MLRNTILICLSAVLAGSFGAVAQVEDSMFKRDRNLSVVERIDPEYQATGIRNGAFTIRPTVDVGLEANDNIFAAETDEESDTILNLAPAVTATSDWSRHSLSANASVDHREYFSFGNESTTGYGVGVDGIIDVRRGTEISLGASTGKQFEPRTAPGAAQTSDDPVEFNQSDVYAGISHEAGRIRVSGQIGFANKDYEDVTIGQGVVQDQDFRDEDRVSYEAKGEYAVSPDTALFVRARYETKDFPEDAALQTRDQDGTVLDVGANFDISNLARGEVAVGYYRQEFDSPTAETLDGFSVEGQVEWFATPLITVRATANRGAESSPIPGAPAFISTGGSLQADYSYRRNVLLTAGASTSEDDYKGVDRKDDRYEIYAGGTYLLNRNVGLNVRLSHADNNSKGLASQPSFTVNKVTVGLRYQI